MSVDAVSGLSYTPPPAPADAAAGASAPQDQQPQPVAGEPGTILNFTA